MVSDIKADSCYLTWDAPEDNGGSEITNYIVERRDASKKKSDFDVLTINLIDRRYGVRLGCRAWMLHRLIQNESFCCINDKSSLSTDKYTGQNIKNYSSNQIRNVSVFIRNVIIIKIVLHKQLFILNA